MDEARWGVLYGSEVVKWGKARQALLGQRMLCCLLQHLEGHRGNVGPGSGRFNDMQEIADAGCQCQRGELVLSVGLHRVANHLHAILGDVVEPPHKGTDDIGAGQLRKARLCG